MNPTDRIHRYLAGRISNSSFRKWLLGWENPERYFSEDDFNLLKKHARTYSDLKGIKRILSGYADVHVVSRLKHSRLLDKLYASIDTTDLLLVIRELRSIAEVIDDAYMIRIADYYSNLFLHTPQLSVAHVWNPEAFQSRRYFLESYRQQIAQDIAELRKQYHFDL